MVSYGNIAIEGNDHDYNVAAIILHNASKEEIIEKWMGDNRQTSYAFATSGMLPLLLEFVKEMEFEFVQKDTLPNSEFMMFSHSRPHRQLFLWVLNNDSCAMCGDPMSSVIAHSETHNGHNYKVKEVCDYHYRIWLIERTLSRGAVESIRAL